MEELYQKLDRANNAHGLGSGSSDWTSHLDLETAQFLRRARKCTDHTLGFLTQAMLREISTRYETGASRAVFREQAAVVPGWHTDLAAMGRQAWNAMVDVGEVIQEAVIVVKEGVNEVMGYEVPKATMVTVIAVVFIASHRLRAR